MHQVVVVTSLRNNRALRRICAARCQYSRKILHDASSYYYSPSLSFWQRQQQQQQLRSSLSSPCYVSRSSDPPMAVTKKMLVARGLSSSSSSSSISPSLTEVQQHQQQQLSQKPLVVAFSNNNAQPLTRQQTTPTATIMKSTNDVWKSTTRQLLSMPAKEWEQQQQQYQYQASQCLLWWARQRPITRQAQSTVWKLWQRLFLCMKTSNIKNSSNIHNDSSMQQQQQQQQQQGTAVVTPDLLNIVLDHWRLASMTTTMDDADDDDDDDYSFKTPLQLHQQLEKDWIPAGLVNTRSYALLLAAMSQNHTAIDAHEAEQVLKNMLSSSSNSSSTSSSSSIQPNIVVWNTVLGHWAKASRAAAAAANDASTASSTAARAMDLLQLMKQQQQQQQQQQGVAAEPESAVIAVPPATNPNAISYANVMEALLHGHAQPGPVVEDLFQEMLKTIFIIRQHDDDHDNNDTRNRQYSMVLSNDSHEDDDNQHAVSSIKALEIAHLRRLQAWTKTDLNRAVEILNDMRLEYYSSQKKEINNNNNNTHLGDGDGDYDCNNHPQQQLAKNVVVAPTSRFYSVVMSALARQPQSSQEQSSSSSGSSGSNDSSLLSSLPPLEQVTRLLEDLYHLYEKSNHDERFLPSSSYIYNPILTAFTRKQEQSSKNDENDDDCIAQQAQNLLLSFYQRAQQGSSTSDSGHATKCLPDQSCFNTVINAWAESLHPQRIQHAEALIQMMHEATASGESPTIMKPDAYTYSLLIKAWSRDATNRSNKEYERRRALFECQELLRTMWEAYHSQQNVSMKPNHITYSTILYAYSQLSRPRLEDVLQAEALFHEMLDCSTSSGEKNNVNGSSSAGDASLAPQQAAYESIMNTWVRSQLPQAAARVAFYFDHLRARSMAAGSSTGSRPSVRIYNSLLAAKKLIGDGEGAEQVLETMMQDYFANRQQQQRRGRSRGEKGDATATTAVVAQPTVATFNTALMAWSRGCNLASSSGAKGSTKESQGRNRLQAYTAASRAEALLRRMEAFATHNNTSKRHSPSVSYSWEKDCRPNTRSYSIVLECWSKLSSRKGARRAESLLYDMVQKFDATGDIRIRPNIYCFTTVMMAWARSGIPDAPERTQLILNELIARYQSEKNVPGNNDHDHDSDSGSLWAPNSEAYMALILAWTKSGRPEGPAKALGVLNEMAHLHEQDPTTFERPGALHCSAVIVAFAEQGDVENAERLLQRILSEHARDGVVLPERACFLGVMKAYANCAQSILDAPERAELILNDMRQNAEQYGYLQLSPDHRAYNAVLGVWLASRRPEAFERGLTLLHQMVQKHPYSNDNNDDEDSKKNVDSTQQQQRRNLKPVYPNEGFFLTLLRILAQSNLGDKADQANKVVQLLQTCGIQRPYSPALNKAIQICLRPPI